MLQNLYCLICLITTAFLSSIDAFSNDRGTVRYRTNGHMTMLKDDQMKPKVITPNDIASLFGGSSSSSSSSSEEADEISYEDDDDEEETFINEKESIKEEIIPEKNTITEKRSYDSESVAMNELLALQKEYFTPPPAPIVPVSNIESSVEEPAYRQEISDEFEDVDELINFDRVLEPESGRRVRQSMTLTENRFANNRLDSNLQTAPRQVKYDPAELLKQARDPMQYGAYRRWKLAEDSLLDSKGKPKKKSSKSSTGYNKGDYEVDGAMGGDAVGGSRNVGGNKKKKDKKGGNNLNPESFYDAIKNFGAGGGKDAGTGGTGTAEPPSNKNPIQPKKAQVKKNKKKLITPDDINSLFGKAEVADDDDEEEVSVESSMGTAVTASSSISGAFNPMMRDDEETPQWILDADKEALQKKKGKGKKKKALTDDWRFWAAIIGVAGFASAFFNIYQQTGGFGGGDSKGFGEGTELVI